MAEVLKERNEMDPKYQWDLSSLYKNDEEWEKDFAKMDELIAKTASFEGKLKDAKTVREFLDTQNELTGKLENVAGYASLRRSEDTRAQKAQIMWSKAYGKIVQATTALSFAEPEFLSLPEEILAELVKDPLLKDYAFNLEKILRMKPHTLSAAEERLLAGFGEVLGAPGEIASNLMDADLLFDDVTDKDGKTVEVNDSNYILLQSSEDRVLRENSFRSYYKGYKNHINTFAATYAANVKAMTAEAKARHYGSSREMSLYESNIPLEVYDQLIAAVHRHMPAMYRYVDLRKRLLGLDQLHYYDVYAPLTKGSDDKYTYEEAQKMVLDAVAPLGENYVNVVKEGLENRWIDVYPNKGKTGGAFSAGTYDSNPVILTNFTGTLDSVSTSAHEMGHSMHTWHSKTHQPRQYADYTMFVAEVASTVNENLMIEQLLQKESDPEKRLVLLEQYLENFKGTVYRQTMFAEFEKEAHALAEKGEALDPVSLNNLYEGLVKEYFGEEMVIDPEVQYEWARIPHFYSPFYVYVYATGYSSAVALSEGILKEGEPARKRYIEFLSMGGSRYPLDELKHAGVDLTTPEPVDIALTKFEKVLEEAEKLAAQLGK